MTQTDLTRALAKTFGFSHVKSQRILRTLLRNITQTLAANAAVSFRNFGSFRQVRRAAKKVRHPKTGEIITIPPRVTVSFSPSPALEKRLK